MFKKLVLLIFSLSILVSSCGKVEESQDVYKNIIARDKLIVGTQFDAKPFGYIDKDKMLKGVDIDIALELAKRLLGSKDKIQFVQVTPSSRIQAITSGEVDIVIATMSITPQRKTIVDFSTPYYIAGQAILVPQNSSIGSYNDLNNKPVIVILGTTGEKQLRYFAPKAILKGYKTYSDGFKALKNGKAEAITTDDSILLGFVMDNNNYKILSKRLTQEPYGVAFKNTEDALILKNNVNRALNEMRLDGFLNSIYKKWGI